MSKNVSWLAGAMLFTVSLVALAQSKVGEDFTELAKPSTEVIALGPDLFGDQVSLYTGTVQFSVTDIAVPGNSALPVAIGRTVTPQRSSSTLPGQFGNWDLDIPHLHGVFSETLGWQVSTGNPNQRCSVDRSNFRSATPPNANGIPLFPFASAEYWAGNMLYIPGQGDKKMLVVAPGNTNVPSDGRNYYWVTHDEWAFACLPATANGVPGEAFLAKSPEGVVYTFNWFVDRGVGTLSKPSSVCATPCISTLDRKEVWILPTRVEDRFGNWVSYTYDPSRPWRLNRIDANDGRRIDLAYDGVGRIATASTDGRVWRYGYSTQDLTGSLVSVTLPDNSQWSLDPALGKLGPWSYSMHSDCMLPPSFVPTTRRFVMTHPSGAVGEFIVTTRRHGRSYVPRTCSYLIGGASFAQEANIIDALSLDTKTISGPGLGTPMSWAYEYGPANASYAEECKTACPTTKTVTITQPDGHWEKHTFSNRYDALEGKLLVKETGSSVGTLRTETTSYVEDGSGTAYPALIGSSPCYRCDKDGQTYTPVASQTVVQDGASFAARFESFDAFARPTRTVESSSLGYTRSDATAF
jgi:YD repeat-containing protein